MAATEAALALTRTRARQLMNRIVPIQSQFIDGDRGSAIEGHLLTSAVDEVLVNLHYRPDAVRRHLATRTGAPAVHTFFEPELLGSAGTLAANRDWVAGEDMFLACNADNLTDFDLRSLIQAHREHGAIATLAVFHSDRPSAGGLHRRGGPLGRGRAVRWRVCAAACGGRTAADRSGCSRGNPGWVWCHARVR